MSYRIQIKLVPITPLTFKRCILYLYKKKKDSPFLVYFRFANLILYFCSSAPLLSATTRLTSIMSDPAEAMERSWLNGGSLATSHSR